MTVARLLSEASSYELTAWSVFHEVQAERMASEREREAFVSRIDQGR